MHYLDLTAAEAGGVVRCPQCSSPARACDQPHGGHGPQIHCESSSLHNFPMTRTLTARIAGKTVT